MKLQEKISVSEVAQILGTHPQTIRAGLIQGRFPFGTAVKMKRWVFIINKEKFLDYIGKPAANAKN